MTCKPTATLKAGELDFDAIRARYAHERDKRLRREGQGQYRKVESLLGDFYEEDPHVPVTPRDPVSEEFEVAVIGAGWSGLLSAYYLKQAGVTGVRTIELAGDFGGCWYWNRYPGIECDNEAYCYMSLLEETDYIPSRRFAPGWEIQEHFQRIATRFGLYEGALFHTRITAIRWDEAIGRWRISTNRGDDLRPRFVVMGSGIANTPKLPGIPGIDRFKGKTFHTARWDYGYTGGNPKNPVLDQLADKRVAIIGTGASSVQAVPYLGRYAKQLYVIQRTPSSVDFRKNAPTDPAWAATLTPGWQARRRDNYHRFTHSGFKRGETDQVCDIWTEINRNISAELEEEGWPELDIEQFFARRAIMDFQVMDRLRRRVEETVEDRETAEALKPWYSILCKRPTSNDEYYPTFNRPNVRLLDVAETRGLEGLTENGFLYRGEEIEVDCVIFASGFEITSELKQKWGFEEVTGRAGRSLYDHWADGYRTLHGVTSNGFPNMFFTGLIQGGLNVSLPLILGQQGEHIAWLVSQTLARGATVLEPSEEAQDAWVRDIRATSVDLTPIVRDCTPGYYNNEGEDKVRWYLGESWGPGWDPFIALIEDWKAQGTMPGMMLDGMPARALSTHSGSSGFDKEACW